MRCPQCSANLSQGTRQCTHCGAVLHQTMPPPLPPGVLDPEPLSVPEKTPEQDDYDPALGQRASSTASPSRQHAVMTAQSTGSWTPSLKNPVPRAVWYFTSVIFLVILSFLVYIAVSDIEAPTGEAEVSQGPARRPPMPSRDTPKGALEYLQKLIEFEGPDAAMEHLGGHVLAQGIRNCARQHCGYRICARCAPETIRAELVDTLRRLPSCNLRSIMGNESSEEERARIEVAYRGELYHLYGLKTGSTWTFVADRSSPGLMSDSVGADTPLKEDAVFGDGKSSNTFSDGESAYRDLFDGSERWRHVDVKSAPKIVVGELRVRLKGMGAPSYVLFKSEVELDSEFSRSEVEERITEIRRAWTHLLSQKTRRELMGQRNMETIRRQMLKTANEQLSAQRIVHVWPTEWIVD